MSKTQTKWNYGCSRSIRRFNSVLSNKEQTLLGVMDQDCVEMLKGVEGMPLLEKPLKFA